jgi:hypothetical protein
VAAGAPQAARKSSRNTAQKPNALRKVNIFLLLRKIMILLQLQEFYSILRSGLEEQQAASGCSSTMKMSDHGNSFHGMELPKSL